MRSTEDVTTRPTTDYTTRPLIQEDMRPKHTARSNSDIAERLAWIHRTAAELTASDMVELKYALRRLAKEANELHDMVRDELQLQRRHREGARLCLR